MLEALCSRAGQGHSIHKNKTKTKTQKRLALSRLETPSGFAPWAMEVKGYYGSSGSRSGRNWRVWCQASIFFAGL